MQVHRHRVPVVGLRQPDKSQCPKVPFCGPTALAAITGLPVHVIEAWFNYFRGLPHDTRVTVAWDVERRAILEALGYEVEEVTWCLERPTLAAWLAARSGQRRTQAAIVTVTGHFVAVSGDRFCDSVVGLTTTANAYGRRKRVSAAMFVYEAPGIAAAVRRSEAILGPPDAPPVKLSLNMARMKRAAKRNRYWERRGY